MPVLLLVLKGDVLCHLCTAGFNCTLEERVICPEGHFSLLGQADCEECSPGQACPLPFILPISCSEGQHTNGEGGATQCMECPPGYYCSQPRYSCVCVCACVRFSWIFQSMYM